MNEMSQFNRIMLFVLVTTTAFLIKDIVTEKYFPPPPEPKKIASANKALTPELPDAGMPAALANAAPGQPTAPAIEPDELPGPNVTIETPLWTAEITPRGGGLVSFFLRGEKQRARSKAEEAAASKTPKGVNLASPGFGQPLPLATDVAVPGGFGVDAVYKVVSQSANELVLSRTRGAVTVSRKLSWKPDSYGLHLAVELNGAPAGNVPVKIFDTSYDPPPPPRSWLSIAPRPEPQLAECYIQGERSVEKSSTVDAKPEHVVPGTPMFAAVDLKYFLGAITPGTDTAATSCSIGTPQMGGAPIAGELVATLTRTVPVGVGVPASTGFDLYFGPKQIDQLTSAGHDLDRSVDLGFFGVIGRWIILPILKTFQKLAGNWGVAIVLLTVLVKFATLPLTHHQMKSMNEGRKLQPEVEKIKTKFAGDQQKIMEETQKMYKEKGYNQLSGCLPMLIQMPIWWALYQTLGVSYEMYNEPFFGWITDLTAIDPYYVTPVLMTTTMMLSQILTPQAAPPTPEMKYMLYFMPVMFGWFMLSLPSGLVLYIFTNNLLSMGQSIWFRRKFPMDKPPDGNDSTKLP